MKHLRHKYRKMQSILAAAMLAYSANAIMLRAQEVLGPLTIGINSAEVFEDSFDRRNGKGDPYLELTLDGNVLYTTEYIRNNHDPNWGENYTYQVNVEDTNEFIIYRVLDDDGLVGDDVIGTGSIRVSDLIGDMEGSSGVDITRNIYRDGNATGKVHFTTSFTNTKAIRDAQLAEEERLREEQEAAAAAAAEEERLRKE